MMNRILLMALLLIGCCKICLAQCGGMTYELQNPIVVENYQYQKSYNLNGDGYYSEIRYTGILEKDQSYYFYVHRRNDQSLYSIKVLSANKELLFENSTDNHLYFTIPKDGLYYLVFEPIKKCSVCDCGIAVLSKKTGNE